MTRFASFRAKGSEGHRSSATAAPVAVIIPTFQRSDRLKQTLQRLRKCDPPPAQWLVHVDGVDAVSDSLAAEFPEVQVLTSDNRVGPGGGRARCLSVCDTPYAVSFDDDSWPHDVDVFKTIVKLFEA